MRHSNVAKDQDKLANEREVEEKEMEKKEITPWVYYVQGCDTLWLSTLVWQNGERGRKTCRFTEERPHCVHIVQPCVASP